MKRALLLAYYFPPIAASGSMRPAGFSSYLEEYGYLPHVVSTAVEDAHPPVESDATLERLVKPGIRVDRLAHRNHLKMLLELRDRASSAAVPPGIDRGEEAADPASVGQRQSADVGLLKRARRRVLERLFLFPDHQKPWIQAATVHAAKLPAEERPDLVFATGNPWSGLVAGMNIARKLKIPFVADFRDPWVRNPKPAVSASLSIKAEQLERKIVHAADRVIANTEELRRAFIEDYPEIEERVVTITNGYNPILMEELSACRGTPEHKCKLEFSHYGSVYELRSPVNLLKAITRLAESGRIVPGDLLIRFVGNWIVESSACNQMADSLESAGYIARTPALPHDEYLRSMQSSQHLLVLQQAFPLQIPGKIYEYLATGRPLVIVGGEGATANLVERYNLGLTCGNSVERLATMLERMVSEEIQVAENSGSGLQRFSYRSLSGELARVFDQLT